MTRHNTHLYLLAAAAVCLAGATAGGSEPVFPGAVGFGTDARAGRGGRIIRVANLNAKGPGSLRAAVEAKGPRIVVFEVGGVIDLNRGNISITEPFLTVAGQTAPQRHRTISATPDPGLFSDGHSRLPASAMNSCQTQRVQPIAASLCVCYNHHHRVGRYWAALRLIRILGSLNKH